MPKINKKIREWENVTKEVFLQQIAPRSEPAIFRGFVKEWALVKNGLESDLNASNYIKRFDKGEPSETWLAPADVNGKFFYQPNMQNVNFQVEQKSLSWSLDRILELKYQKDPIAIFSGSAPVDQCLPGLRESLPCPWLGTSVPPRIWIGNKVTVQTHYDFTSNIACVAAGRRRFTLFPPSQVGNLYPGPIEFTPAGTPVSMVSLSDPDHKRYPRFETALAHAEYAELEPGDAVYIPPLWWHHVESLGEFNILVNFWWNSLQVGPDAPETCLAHGLMSIRNLPEPERLAWRAMFDHYVFKMGGDPVAHLAPEHRGMLGEMTTNRYAALKNYFIECYKGNQNDQSWHK